MKISDWEEVPRDFLSPNQSRSIKCIPFNTNW